ncbi:LPS export ABC transporter permease LptG [candidate division WOR-3 bacterium]|nr:LPS export ABC transporter permease LptG [candidate division WOR-3 bacterium]
MKILDRYLLLEFLKALVFILLAFIFIFIIVDLFDDLSKFIEKKVVIFDIILFYFYQIPSIAVLVFPVGVLLSLFFSLGMMARNFEILALKSNGISLNRVFLTYLIAGFVLSIFVIFINEMVVPYANEKVRNHKRTKINKLPAIDYRLQNNLKYLGENGYTYSIKTYDGRKEEIRRVSIIKFDKTHKIVRRIDAEKAVWKDGVWEFQNGYLRVFTDTLEQRVFKFLKRQFPELKEKPEDFSRRMKSLDEMKYTEVKNYVGKLKKTGKDPSKALVELYTKISFPFVTFIIIILGAPLSADTRRSGLAFGFGLSLLISFIYWGLLQVSKAYGIKGNVPPVLAAWLPNIIFAAIGIFLIIRIRK